MAWITQPLSPGLAKRFYGSNPTELRRCADEAQVYLDHLREELTEGPPDVDPSLSLNPEKMEITNLVHRKHLALLNWEG